MNSKTARRYICQRCGTCCRWPGIVRIPFAEINNIAAHLGITPEQFISEYTVLAPDRQGLVLREHPDGACILLNGNTCRIHAVKPQQCRDFPAHWNFEGFEKLCRALPVPCTEPDA